MTDHQQISIYLALLYTIFKHFSAERVSFKSKTLCNADWSSNFLVFRCFYRDKFNKKRSSS